MIALGKQVNSPEAQWLLSRHSEIVEVLMGRGGVRHASPIMSEVGSGERPVLLSSALHESVSRPDSPRKEKKEKPRASADDPEAPRSPAKPRLPVEYVRDVKPGHKISRLIVYLIGALTGGVLTTLWDAAQEETNHHVLNKKKKSSAH
jgi:hypothetical protein